MLAPRNFVIPAFLIVIISALVAFTNDDNVGYQETILDVKNVAIDFFNPAKFYFYKEDGCFKDGDVISFNVKILPIAKKNVRKVLGGGKFEHLKIIMTNLNSGQEKVIYSADFGKPFEFGDTNGVGNFSMEVTGTKKLTPMHITVVKRHKEPPTEKELGQTYDIVHVETMYIGEHTDAQPKFSLGLNKNDMIVVESTSSLTIKFKVFQTGKTYTLPVSEPLTMAEDGLKTFEFVLELEKEKNGFLKFKKGDKRFIDLIIKRKPYIEPKANASGAAGSGSDGNGVGGSGENVEDDPTSMLANSMEQMQKSGENSSAAIIENMNNNMKALIEQMNQKNFTKKPKWIGGSSEKSVFNPLTVSSKLDLTGKQKLCKPIELQPSNYWAFWLGVGEDANKEYDERQKDLLNRASRDQISSLLEHYALAVVDKVNSKISYPSFSAIAAKLEDSGEFVEYAIVNETNKYKFEKGEKFTSYKSSWKNLNAVTDYGNSTLPGEKLFLCLCNHNKMTPANVFFKYETYNVEQVQL